MRRHKKIEYKKKQEMCAEGVDNFRSAIVIQAVKDYKALLSGRIRPTYSCDIPELERFFRSEWYKLLCDYDGERLMELVKEMVRKEKASSTVNTGS